MTRRLAALAPLLALAGGWRTVRVTVLAADAAGKALPPRLPIDDD